MGLRTSSFPDSKNWNSHTHVTHLHNLHDHFFCGFCPHRKPILIQWLPVRPTFLCSFQLKGRDLTRLLNTSFMKSYKAPCERCWVPSTHRIGSVENWKNMYKAARARGSRLEKCHSVLSLLSPSSLHIHHFTAVYDGMRSYMVRPDLTLFCSYTRLQFKENYFVWIVPLQLYEQTFTQEINHSIY